MRGLSFVSPISAALATLLGAIAVIEWTTNSLRIARISAEFIPMAPSTALCFVMLGTVLLCRQLQPDDRVARRVWRALASIVLIFSGALLFQFALVTITHAALDIEHLIVPATLAEQGFIVGRMSPITAFLFILLSFATLVFFPIRDVGRLRYGVAQSAAAVVFILAGILVVGYWYGAPLLYGGTVTPVALPTAVGFMLLSAGLLFDGTNAIFYRWITSTSIFARFTRLVLPSTIAIILVISWFHLAVLDYLPPIYHVVFSSLVALFTAGLVALLATAAAHQVQRAVTRADQALRASEERFHGLFQHMVEGYAYCQMVFENGQARDFIYLEVNDAFETLTGLKDVIGKRVTQVIPGIRESDPELFDIYARVSVTGKPEKFEMFVEALKLWFAVSVYSPEKGFFVAVFDVITERKRAEVALRESESRYRDLVEHSHDLICTHDLTGNILSVNPATTRITGYSEDELLSMNVRDTLAPKFRDQFDDYLAEIKAKGSASGLMLVQTKSGEKRIWEYNNTLRTQGVADPIVRGMARDITERKRAEEESLRRNARLAALHQVGQALNQLAPPREILERIYSIIGQVLDNRNLYIALYDEANQTISFPVYTIEGERRKDYPARQLRNGLTEYVLRTKTPLFIPRNLEAALVERGIDLMGRPSRCYLAVPILTSDKILGVIAVQDYEREDVFSESDLELLSTIALQTATALENARLFEETHRRAEEFAALYETTRDFTFQQDLATLLEMIVARAIQLIGASGGTIGQYDRTRGEVEIIAAKNSLAPLGNRVKVGQGVAGRTVETNAPLIVNDYKNWEYRLSPMTSSAPIESALGVPLFYAGEIIGVVTVYQSDPNAHKFTDSDAHLLSLFAAHAAAAISNTRLLDETRQRAEQLALLYDAGLALNSVLEPRRQLEFLSKIAIKTLRADRANFFRYEEMTNQLKFELGVGVDESIRQRLEAMTLTVESEKGFTAWVARHRVPLYVPDAHQDPRTLFPDSPMRAELWVPVQHEGRLLGVLGVLSARVDAFSPNDERLLVLFGNQVAVAHENARLFVETQQRLAEMQTINKISTSLRVAQTLDEMLPLLLDETLGILNTTAGMISLYDATAQVLRDSVTRGWFTELDPAPLKMGEGVGGYVWATGEPYTSKEFARDPRASSPSTIPPGWGGTVVPIRTADQVIGVLYAAIESPREIQAVEIRLLTTIAEIAGNAIHRMRLNEKNLLDARRLAALHSIDVAISSNFDLRSTLSLVLQQVIELLNVDAADVLLLNPQTLILEYSAGRGFRTRAIEQSRVHLGEGYAGRAALERRMVEALDINALGVHYGRGKLLAGEGFASYFGVPLIAKGQVLGVLDTFTRTQIAPDQDWRDFAESLAGQAAIAIDNANLFDNLQRSNIELGLAYDTTLEGWSRALDLRDKETEGHTQRVTEMTLRLARRLGMKEEDFAQIRRGGLLHDIGKMGIPDSILHKPGPLTETEWEIMRKHPTFAYELLSPIAYLRPALDIPYCHHEKWDGSGYPRGLKGEQIPLAARIFAVVDVWDALTSDRPYRKAWSKEKTREYLRAQSGKHFEPRVVEEFLQMIEEE